MKHISKSVHPRIYGEHSIRVAARIMNSGSSPYIRGTLLMQCRFGHPERFIPVYTGNIPRRKTVTSVTPVHPRIYGEHLHFAWRSFQKTGSSPYIRGTSPTVTDFVYIDRFIPVYTGNMDYHKPAPGLPPVHPRIYGEHAADHNFSLFSAGSSPYIRGTFFTVFHVA